MQIWFRKTDFLRKACPGGANDPAPNIGRNHSDQDNSSYTRSESLCHFTTNNFSLTHLIRGSKVATVLFAHGDQVHHVRRQGLAAQVCFQTIRRFAVLSSTASNQHAWFF